MTSPCRLTALLLLVIGVAAASANAFTDEDRQKARESVTKGIEYLRKQQNEDGAWSPRYGPAVTALVVTAMLDQPNISPEDPHVRKAITYILKQVKEDGGIHSGMLETYNTAICISALSRVQRDPRVAQVLKDAERYLRSLQYGDEEGRANRVSRDHVFHGGYGYGTRGRPDGANTVAVAQAFRDLGVDCDDPAFQQMVTYLGHLQGTPDNKVAGDLIAPDGGAIYAIDKDETGKVTGQSTAGTVEVKDEEERVVNRLATYGGMTYAMFKTYVYAQLNRDDPRVQAAYRWIQHHYTVEVNPGMPEGKQTIGYYYYLMTMARSLKAWNAEVRDTEDKPLNWRLDLSRKLTQLQREDGSWVNTTDRYAEGDPHIVTAYALIALNNVLGYER